MASAVSRLTEAGGGALILDLSELGTKSDKKINIVLSSIDPTIKVIGLGSGYDLKSVTSFYRSGLADFLDLPVDPFLLSRALNNVLGNLATVKTQPAPIKQKDPFESQNQPAQSIPGGFIVGRDPSLMKVFRIVEKVAATDSTVMIHGESGTGKELIARDIHQTSPRSTKPLIPVNCGAIPEELLETELFGHEKGAFTNAIRDRTGRFEMADGGTIFLDEIGDMSPKLQVKLLRVIQEHEFEKVGGDKTISVDIRIITATHVDLTQAVDDGRFREDLYYRLNVIPLTIPPLRARSGDIPLLVDYFLARLRETRASKVTSLTPEVMSVLKAYHWPGNIRELENLMERMVILADGPILTIDDLPQRLLKDTEGKVQPLVIATYADAQTKTSDQSTFLDFSTLLSDSPDLPSGASSDPTSGPSTGPPTSSVATESHLESEPLTTYDQSQASSFDISLSPFVEPLINFPAQGVDLSSLVGQYEDRLIRAALAANGGVKNQTAKALGLSRTTFLDKLKKRGID
jgi:DNA-binding NtrC family response regulator